MKKYFKGFTLVECIVALAILSIASLTMAEIYAVVAKRNKDNHFMNTSLSNQMAYIESYTDSQTVAIYYDGKAPTAANHKDSAIPTPPHKQGIAATDYTKPFVQIESSYKYDSSNKGTYSYSADVYVMLSRDRSDNQLSNDAGYTEDNHNLRYKYILGHDN